MLHPGLGMFAHVDPLVPVGTGRARWVGGRTPPPWTGWSDAGRGWSDAGCETVKIFFARCAREVKFSLASALFGETVP